MSQLEEVTKEVQVPANTGVAGFMRTLEGILKLPRVYSVTISVKGVVTYTRYVSDEEETALNIDFSGLRPRDVIVGGQLVETALEGLPHQRTAEAFERAQQASVVPVAWATGVNSILRQWYEESSVSLIDLETFFGLPVYRDEELEDSALILCAAYARKAVLSDCHKFYKISMNVPNIATAGAGVGPVTTVNVL